jgi:hypothetical protein
MYAAVIDKTRKPIQNTVNDTLLLTPERGMSEDNLHKIGMEISRSKLSNGNITRNIDRKKTRLIKNFKEEIFI